MATFNEPVRTKHLTRTQTFEGGAAVLPPTLVDLAFTAACTFIGQDTFYESGADRHQRIIDLTVEAAKTDPDGVVELIRRVRRDFKIRAAAIVIAAEFVNAQPGYRTREAVTNACWRADEPGEFLAYWWSRFGKRLPRGVKLGLADAARKLYTQQGVLKWDSKDRSVRMGDVIEVAHIKPETAEEATLFRYMLDLRHRGKDAWEIDSTIEGQERPVRPGLFPWSPSTLQLFMNRRVLMEIPEADRRQVLRTWGMDFLTASGITWEQLSSWLPGGMDAEAWSFAIPRMQVMALIRNLRNFDKAGLPEPLVDAVIAKITSEDDVRKSRIFPYQVLTAYRYAESDNWARALGKTLDHASGNVSRLDRSLILIDTSGSMQSNLSSKSVVQRVEVAALQAVSVARASNNVNIVIYGDSSYQIPHSQWRAKSVLKATEYIRSLVGHVGHATYGHTAIRDHFDPNWYDRAIIFTDDQQADSGSVSLAHVPQLVTFNAGGYAPKSTWGRIGAQTNVQVAGFSDDVFSVVAELLVN